MIKFRAKKTKKKKYNSTPWNGSNNDIPSIIEKFQLRITTGTFVKFFYTSMNQ